MTETMLSKADCAFYANSTPNLTTEEKRNRSTASPITACDNLSMAKKSTKPGLHWANVFMF